jgi:hypothetical protein
MHSLRHVRALGFFALPIALSACSSSSSASKTQSVACYLDTQFLCREYPTADDQKVSDASVACSSGSGVFTQPAACPNANFQGKCTSTENGYTKIEFFYTGADVAYAQDFCVNTAKGIWATTF